MGVKSSEVCLQSMQKCIQIIEYFIRLNLRCLCLHPSNKTMYIQGHDVSQEL